MLEPVKFWLACYSLFVLYFYALQFTLLFICYPLQFTLLFMCYTLQFTLFFMFYALECTLLFIFCFMSAISRQSVVLEEETGVLSENHQPAASYLQTLSHKVVSNTPRLNRIRTHSVSGDMHWLHK